MQNNSNPLNVFLDANGQPYQLPQGERVYWRISGYGLVRSECDKVLMVVPTWNILWELPGGGVDEGESIAEGIKREVYEETGYSITLSDTPFHVSESNFYHRYEKKFYHSVIMVYLAELLWPEQDIEVINTYDGDEISKIEWKPLEDLDERSCHSIIYPVIRRLKYPLN